MQQTSQHALIKHRNTAAGDGSSVAILLSLYNGASYLQQQLDSLRQQTWSNWTLFWRDDGSTDSTLTIMQQFTRAVGPARCVEVPAGKGAHLGVTGSYATLLEQAPAEAAVAFCDQDDVWFPDKLERGMRALATVPDQTPALYCTRQTLTNKTLTPLSLSPELPDATSFLPAMTQNIATGCTLMLSPAACALLRKAMPAPTFLLHDWWAYLMVAGAGGRVLTDNQPSLFYRQHEKNAVGARSHFLLRALAALRRGPTAFMNIFRANTLYLLRRKTLLAPETVKALDLLQKTQQPGWRGLLTRVSALHRLKQLRRHKTLEDLVFRVWFLLG